MLESPYRTVQVACPKCGAAPERPCHAPSGDERGVPHIARRNAHPGWDRKRREWRKVRSEHATQERLTAAQCLRNAHGHIARAYAQIDGNGMTPGHKARMIHETLDAVDWIRRALEHMDKVDAP